MADLSVYLGSGADLAGTTCKKLCKKGKPPAVAGTGGWKAGCSRCCGPVGLVFLTTTP